MVARTQAVRFEKAMRLGLNVSDLTSMNTKEFGDTFNIKGGTKHKIYSKGWERSVEGQRRNLISAYKNPTLQQEAKDIMEKRFTSKQGGQFSKGQASAMTNTAFLKAKPTVIPATSTSPRQITQIPTSTPGAIDVEYSRLWNWMASNIDSDMSIPEFVKGLAIPHDVKQHSIERWAKNGWL